MTAPHRNVAIGTPYKKKGKLWSLGWHTGDDWLTPTGTKAYAMGDGTVRSVSYNSAYGNNVIVESVDKNGRRIRWSVNHLSRFKVKTGQKVKAGDLIGYTGATGHVTGPHDHVETRVSPFTFAARSFIDPQTMYDWKAKIRVPAVIRPKTPPPLWWGLDFRNLAGFNTHGEATWTRRIPKIVDDIKTVGRAVVVVLELPNGKVADFTRRMRAVGYYPAGGYNGRHVFNKESVVSTKSTSGNLAPTLKGDKKAWFATKLYVTRGVDEPIILATTQLENQDASGTTQVRQAKDFIKVVEAWAKAEGVPKERIFWALDSNSDSRVLVEAFGPANYVDAAAVAWKSENSAWRSFVGWSRKPTKGKRIDLVLCYRTQVVRKYRLRTITALFSDHLALYTDFGKPTK